MGAVRYSRRPSRSARTQNRSRHRRPGPAAPAGRRAPPPGRCRLRGWWRCGRSSWRAAWWGIEMAPTVSRGRPCPAPPGPRANAGDAATRPTARCTPECTAAVHTAACRLLNPTIYLGDPPCRCPAPPADNCCNWPPRQAQPARSAWPRAWPVPRPGPARPVKIVVTFPPGGSSDVVARILAEHMAQAPGPAGGGRQPARRRRHHRRRGGDAGARPTATR